MKSESSNTQTNQMKLFSSKDTEIIFNYISKFLDNSKYSTTPLNPEDIALVIEDQSNNTLRITIKNIKEGNESFTTYQIDYGNYITSLLQNEHFSKGTNELTKKELMHDFTFSFDKKILPQINQIQLYELTKENKFIPSNQSYEEYSLYITVYITEFESNRIQLLKKLHQRNPKIFKKSNLVFILMDRDSDEQYIQDYKELKEKYLKDFEEIQAAYNILFTKKDKISSNSAFWNYNNILSIYRMTGFILDKEGKTIKKITFKEDCQVDSLNKLIAIGDKLKPLSKESKELISALFQIRKQLAKLPYFYTYTYKISLKTKVTSELTSFIPINIKSLNVKCELQSKEIEIIKKFKEYNKNPKFVLTIKEIETFSIDLKDFKEIKCANITCNTIITNKDGFYYCYWCKLFFCEKCVEDQFNQDTEIINRYLHKEHNLLYLPTTDEKYLSNLTKKRLGTNLFASQQDDLDMDHSAACNGCGGSIYNGPRYVCVTCRPGITQSGGFCDYCFTCFNHMRQDDATGKSIQEKGVIDDFEDIPNYDAMNKLHCHKTHLYLLLIAQVDGYYNY